MNKEYYMQLALDEAKKGLTTTFPNPAVGCVIVKDDQVLAKGYHHKAGGPHAEIEALKQVDFDAKGCDVYVTLEPCSHYGKTPPCSDALIKAGAKHVFVSVQDPNPMVNGNGIQRLRSHGIDVEVGVLETEGKEVLKYFTHQIQHKRPYITLKAAMSLNGFINKEKGVRTQLTGHLAYETTLALRKQHDAILIGGETIRVDNPSFAGMKKIVLSNTKLDPKLNIFQTEGEVIQYENIELNNLLADLYQRGIGSVFVEGGGHIFQQFIEKNLYNELILYMAPHLFSTQQHATAFYHGSLNIEHLQLKEIKQMKQDVMLRYQNTKSFKNNQI